MKTKSIFNIAYCALFLTFSQSTHAQFSSLFGPDQTVTQQRQAILKKNDEILQHLYKKQPKAKAVIEEAIGYGTFSNFGMKIFIAGGGSGSGVVFNKANSKPIFMDMVEVQAGLGIGIKSYQNIFVFQTKAALNDFVNSGWTFGGQANASAKYDNNGSAYQDALVVAPGILIYQLTDSGLSAEITGKGTKFYQNTELNK